MPNHQTRTLPNARREWLRVLALSDVDHLRETWSKLPGELPTRFLRAPEIGLAMVRGRAGGAGDPFNLGEMSVTRCVVVGTDRANGERLDGVGVVAGRDKEKAELVAKLDAAFQDSATPEDIRQRLIADLEHAHTSAKATKSAKTAATKVEFFTIERGHQ